MSTETERGGRKERARLAKAQRNLTREVHDTPTVPATEVSKGDWVVFEPREDRLEKPNQYWVERVGREFLVLDAGPVRVLLWDDQYYGPEGGGEAISCNVEDVRVVRSMAQARREGAAQGVAKAAAIVEEHSRTASDDRARVVLMEIANILAGTAYADAIEAGKDPS